MTRGFITVATGKDNYYIQALNLLHSFKLFNPETPFAILCDRENEYTKEFDDVVIIDNPKISYLDKFRILTDCPYDENIFIETDCLVYHSLDNLWDLLSCEYDFSSFGWNDAGLKIWFTDEMYGAEKFLGGKNAMPLFNPGYLFIRKGQAVLKMYDDAMSIIDSIMSDEKLSGGNGHEADKHLFVNGNLRDDPVFALAMQRSGFRCAQRPKYGKCIALPSVKEIYRISFSEGKLDVYQNRKYEDCNILHFSSKRVNEDGLYLQQILALNLIMKKSNSLLIKIAESRLMFTVLNFYKKIHRRIKELARNK